MATRQRSAAWLVMALLAVAATTAWCMEFDAHAWGTSEESLLDESESVFLESSSAVSGGEWPASAAFANLTPHVTYEEASNHCNATEKGLTLCPSSSLCDGGVPVDGARTTRAYVPVKDATNKWMSVGPDRTCEVRDGGKWGTTAVYKSIKGLVACCNAEGVVRRSMLSRWEGFLIKIANVSAIWMVENGVRRDIPSAKSFEAMGFHWPRVKTLPRSVVESIPLGQPLPDHNAEKNSNIFDHALLGYDHDGGNPFEQYEGYLVKKEGSNVVCMIVHNSKRCIPDAETFEALAFDYKFVQVVESWLYDSFPPGTPFPSRVGAAAGSEPFVHPILGKDHFGASNLKSTIVGSKRFVRAAVARMLDRAPTPSEEELYLGLLRRSRSVPKLVRRLANSNAFLTKHVFPAIIRGLYHRLLERVPTAAEFSELLAHLQAVRRSRDPTKNVKQLVARFATSKEHMERFVEGAKDRNQAVRTLYKHLLGREAESTKVVEAHAGRVDAEGWRAVVLSFIDSQEYKSNVGLYGVPGEATLYADPIRALHKRFLNVAPEDVSPATLQEESRECAKDGWETYTEEFTKSKAYIAENGKDRFMDEADRTITLKRKQPKKAE